ncbi:MAG: Mpv17/PMP22 family protein [Bacteroidales bacterium]|jgi:hypothetical protein|nr:Mpv17/PMP22 family protein [Bacteroidales bacterium]
MKRSDIITIVGVILFFAPFFVFDSVYQFYNDWNQSNSMSMAFLKFAILATFGEVLGLRIKTGKYSAPGFGLIPRAIIWGFLGMWIAAAMGIFRSGVPAFMDKFAVFNGINEAMSAEFSGMKLLGAFFISLMMNTSFAPVFMTLHKITDTHISQHAGKVSCLLKPIPIRKIIIGLNWDVQWNFVFKKTIPFFWIPAHTITFILPTHLQVLFAALLGVALGVILSIAALKSK